MGSVLQFPKLSYSESHVDFGLPPDIVGATLNGLGVVEIQGLETKVCFTEFLMQYVILIQLIQII